jgi:hypothetical protein
MMIRRYRGSYIISVLLLSHSQQLCRKRLKSLAVCIHLLVLLLLLLLLHLLLLLLSREKILQLLLCLFYELRGYRRRSLLLLLLLSGGDGGLTHCQHMLGMLQLQGLLLVHLLLLLRVERCHSTAGNLLLRHGNRRGHVIRRTRLSGSSGHLIGRSGRSVAAKGGQGV